MRISWWSLPGLSLTLVALLFVFSAPTLPGGTTCPTSAIGSLLSDPSTEEGDPSIGIMCRDAAGTQILFGFGLATAGWVATYAGTRWSRRQR